MRTLAARIEIGRRTTQWRRSKAVRSSTHRQSFPSSLVAINPKQWLKHTTQQLTLAKRQGHGDISSHMSDSERQTSITTYGTHRTGDTQLNQSGSKQIRTIGKTSQHLKGQNMEGLSSTIHREEGTSVASSSKGSKGRNPIPLTPQILHLLDRLEHDKGKQARLLTEHLIGQRTLPTTEDKFQQHLKRKTTRLIKRQHAVAKAATNMATEEQIEADRTTHEAEMAAHLTQQAMAAALASRATTTEAIGAWQVAT